MTGYDLLANLQKLTPEQLALDVCVRVPDSMIYDLSDDVTVADVQNGEIVGETPTCLILEGD